MEQADHALQVAGQLTPLQQHKSHHEAQSHSALTAHWVADSLSHDQVTERLQVTQSLPPPQRHEVLSLGQSHRHHTGSVTAE